MFRPQADDPPPPRPLLAATPSELRLASAVVEDPVLRVILERAEAGSSPGARSDEHVVCLAIEGGGMRGAVSAGMCIVLEAAGLISSFDRIYGVSAGALNGCAAAAGQAAMSATHYTDAADRRVINRMRPLVRGPVVDYGLLFDDVISARKPLSFDALSRGPEFRCLATSLDALTLRVLANFSDVGELVQAIRASATLPGLGGPPPVFRGERMADGALIEPVPFEAALAEGATHVLVLRSRPAGYRKGRLRGLGESLAFRDNPGLVKLLREHHVNYNRQANRLTRGAQLVAGGAVRQIAVSADSPSVGRLEPNGDRVAEAIASGAKAIASVLLETPIDLVWQPAVYRSALTDQAERHVPVAMDSAPLLARES